MRSVERPRRLRWPALLAGAALLATVHAALADGTPEGLGAPLEEAALVPVVLVPMELAAAERVQIEALILATAARRGIDGARLLQIARCESQLNPRITGPAGAAGLFQIIPSTWEWATERLGLSGASPVDPAANVEVAAWLMATLGPGQWPAC